MIAYVVKDVRADHEHYLFISLHRDEANTFCEHHKSLGFIGIEVVEVNLKLKD